MKKSFSKTKIGIYGEHITQRYLKKMNYNIIDRNYRYKKAEIDFIAKYNNLLIFLEVKYRTSIEFGFPEDFISNKKIDLYHMAATHYIKKINWMHNIRFDIISIVNFKDKKKENNFSVDHFKDAF